MKREYPSSPVQFANNRIPSNVFYLMPFLVNRYSKIMELEEELKVVGNSLKSLEVSEEKVSIISSSSMSTNSTNSSEII